MTSRFRFVTTLITVTLMASMSHAAANKLERGDDAPPPPVNVTWVKELTKDPSMMMGKPMVVEFWATWCGPCIRSIPHLTKLQEKYGTDQLTVLGVTSPDKQQTESDIRRFVQKQGSRMDFWVAIDEDGKVTKDFMKAADQKGIPCAFIIGREGRIQFIGHPASREFDDILDKVVRGRFDHKAFERAKGHLKALKRAREVKNWEEYDRISNQVIEMDPQVFADLIIERFDVSLLDRNDPRGAYAIALALPTTRRDDPALLCSLAEHIAFEPSLPDEKRNLDAALALVQAAREAKGQQDPQFLAAEAGIRLARNEVDEAVRLQREAYYQAPPNRKDLYNRTLQDYKARLARDTE